MSADVFLLLCPQIVIFISHKLKIPISFQTTATGLYNMRLSCDWQGAGLNISRESDGKWQETTSTLKVSLNIFM